MKIYSLAKVLILPLVLLAIAIFYYSEHVDDRSLTVWLFIPTILLTVILIFKPQIDYWWHTKYPIPLDPKIKLWLDKYSQFYNSLDEKEKSKFENRLSLYVEAREFKAVGSEVREVPEDIKGIIGSIAVMLTFHDEDFLMGDYDRIYVYKHPFPSPNYKFLHNVEVNHEDGMLIFSLEHLLPGMSRPREFYNIGLHAFIEAYYHHKKTDFPDNKNLDWELIEKSGYYDRKNILSMTGLKYIDLYVVAGVCYFVSPEKLKKTSLKLYSMLNDIFDKPA